MRYMATARDWVLRNVNLLKQIRPSGDRAVSTREAATATGDKPKDPKGQDDVASKSYQFGEERPQRPVFPLFS